MIVPHGDFEIPHYDLVVLDPFLPYLEPRSVALEAGRSELLSGYEAWRGRRMVERERLMATSPVNSLLLTNYDLILQSIGSSFAVQVAERKSFSVLAARLPEIVLTAVPPQAWEVVTNAGKSGTAGAIVRDAQGCIGGTASLHIFEANSSPCLNQQVTVNGLIGTVRATDPISDSCFIELGQLPGNCKPKVTSGPLVGVSPRQYEKVSFEGCTAGFKETIVTGWSPDIPFVQPYNQLKVFTDDVTNPGDSGAALLDKEGHILGFSFFRTGINSVPAFSAWIWAHSVFDVLKLTAL
jgi:hypothetical protein